MAMGNSVEGRYPFLDYRVIEFSNRLPSEVKLRGLTEKWLLKQLGKKLIPSSIVQRPKRPYRAPIHRSFFSPSPREYVGELFTERALQESGYFNPSLAHQLYCKAETGARLSETEDMALAGILSTQIVHDRFVKSFHLAQPAPARMLKIVDMLA